MCRAGFELKSDLVASIESGLAFFEGSGWLTNVEWPSRLDCEELLDRGFYASGLGLAGICG